MGSITSPIKRKLDPPKRKIITCTFCNNVAKQIIVTTTNKVRFSCLDCIPPDSIKLSWIKSIEDM